MLKTGAAFGKGALLGAVVGTVLPAIGSFGGALVGGAVGVFCNSIAVTVVQVSYADSFDVCHFSDFFSVILYSLLHLPWYASKRISTMYKLKRSKRHTNWTSEFFQAQSTSLQLSLSPLLHRQVLNCRATVGKQFLRT